METICWPGWPKYDAEHEDAVLRVIRSNQLYAAGEVAAFEAEFSEFVGSENGVAVGNATQALQLSLAALEVGVGDEVIVTPYSWISSASCVLMQNAIPIFVDIEDESFGIDPQRLEESISPRTKAVILVHMFGLMSRVEEIRAICDRYGIFLIEDSSHAHGATLNGRHAGTFGEIGVFSLHQRKAIPTGDGGILVARDRRHADKIRRLRSFGDAQLSFNYRMTEFSAAIGRVALRGLIEDNKRRRDNHEILTHELAGSLAKLVQPRAEVYAVYYSNLILLDGDLDFQARVLHQINQKGIPLKRTWQPLNQHSHFRREHMVNNAAPWDFMHGYTFTEPSQLSLAKSQEYQTSRIFELDCHPLVDKKIVHAAGSIIRTVLQNAA